MFLSRETLSYLLDWNQRVIDPRWGTQDTGLIRPPCGEWTLAPFIIPFQLKPSKKWLNNQQHANGAIYPSYGRTLVIGLGMSGQCQMSHSNAKWVRQMMEGWRKEESNEKNKEKAMLIRLWLNINWNFCISWFSSECSMPVLMSVTCPLQTAVNRDTEHVSSVWVSVVMPSLVLVCL